jgi:hypothetical protein
MFGDKLSIVIIQLRQLNMVFFQSQKPTFIKGGTPEDLV